MHSLAIFLFDLAPNAENLIPGGSKMFKFDVLNLVFFIVLG